MGAGKGRRRVEHIHERLEGPPSLIVDSDGHAFDVALEGALVSVLAPEHTAPARARRRIRAQIAEGDAIVLAAYFGDTDTIRSTGPESVILLAGPPHTSPASQLARAPLYAALPAVAALIGLAAGLALWLLPT